MRALVPILPILLAAALPFAAHGEAPANGARAPEGYRLMESTAASVNGDVLFLSDIEREACFYRCGAFPGEAPEAMDLSRARERLIADVLVLQEQQKLQLGEVDNAALAGVEAAARTAMRRCGSPCAGTVADREIGNYAGRRLLVRDFLLKRVSVFVDVSEEELQGELKRRAQAGEKAPEAAAVRKELADRKTRAEIGNWFSRAASKSRILLSPLEAR